MAINKKLIHFKNKEAFDRELQAGNIMDTSICWIPDAKFIYTRGTYWYCSSKSDAEIQQLISDIETQLSNKVDKVEGKGLSTNDFTDDLLNLLKKVSKPLNYKGSVPTYNDLPTEGNLEGDVWNVTKTDVNYAWTGTDWDPFGSSAVNIVDDLTTGGATAALSAEQGKVLKGLVDTKVDKVSGKQLSTNDYTTAEKNKLAGLSNYNDADLKASIKLNSDNIASMDAAYKAADEVLQDNIDAEKVARTAADSKLQSDISAEETRAVLAESENLAVIKAETERAKAAEDEIRAVAGGSSTADGGDIPICPLYRQANIMYTKVAETIKDTATLAAYIMCYNKPYIGKPINRIKMMLATPGRCRISIFNEHIFDANLTLEASLVKDLVNVVCTSTGYKYWDLDEDVVVEEGQFIGAWYTADCARYTYNNDLTYQTAYPSGWIGRTNLATEAIPKEDWENRRSLGYLNVGLYRRGDGSDFEWGKLDESANTRSSVDNAYYPRGQEKLVGKTIYKLRLKVLTVGYLTINLINNYGKANAKVLKSWKLYIRQLGVQTVRLPEDITLEAGQGIGVYAEGDTCAFAYGGTPFGTKYALNGWYQYTAHNYATTPGGNTNQPLGIALIERGSKLSSLEDKTISIQGDSISTFAGTITDGNATYYSASHKFVNSIDATWWGLLINECRMRLIRNDAWSGSRISGTGDNAMCSVARCSNIKHIDSTVDTYQYGAPEIIVVMAGTNDVSGNVEMGTADGAVTTYMGAFKTMLANLKSQCRNAKIVVFQLYRGNVLDYANSGGKHQYEYQEAMANLCRRYGVYYIGPEHFDLSFPNLQYYTCDNSLSDYGPPTYTSADYLHPNMQGMERVYAGVRAYLESLY
jgi:lysophospholipase L1-like esterase|nr:MAG TPA: Head fiber protein [Caudoviricetes sp.]